MLKTFRAEVNTRKHTAAVRPPQGHCLTAFIVCRGLHLFSCSMSEDTWDQYNRDGSGPKRNTGLKTSQVDNGSISQSAGRNLWKVFLTSNCNIQMEKKSFLHQFVFTRLLVFNKRYIILKWFHYRKVHNFPECVKPKQDTGQRFGRDEGKRKWQLW